MKSWHATLTTVAATARSTGRSFYLDFGLMQRGQLCRDARGEAVRAHAITSGKSPSEEVMPIPAQLRACMQYMYM